MKNRLLTLLLVALCLSGSIAAQSEITTSTISGKRVYNEHSSNRFKKKGFYSSWKFPIVAIQQLTTLDEGINFLFQDTSVKFIDTSGKSTFNSLMSVGAAFTGNDPNLELIDDNTLITRYKEYNVDSVHFPYLYVRYVDSIEIDENNIEVIDTLIVQFFKFDQMEQNRFTPDGESPEIYMKPSNWTQSLLGANKVAYEIKIPLNAKDSTHRPSNQEWSLRDRFVRLPLNFKMDSDYSTTQLEFKNVFGFSISFKTMVPYEFGDTMEAQNGADITNKMNYFGYSSFTNNSIHVPQNDYINNSWWVPGNIGYGDTINGWFNSIPGNAYDGDRYFNYGLLVRYLIGIEELNKSVTVDLYPNPISNVQTLIADFHLSNASYVTMEIYDLLGNKVKNVVDGYYTGGEHSINLNISDLQSGIYLYSIKAGNTTSVQRLSVYR
ncbi:MAG: hypothetical protein COA58_02120 [Bacteroidetes bacterium]|nr:MAG: hypothetical protein COA58_02120 [Bacteroidota bacterium]